ncbi:MAG: hypothetical protein LCH96_02630 [Actinobacteria bacterium]|nr:hypothetical protein [Actinomycetota bacterium]
MTTLTPGVAGARVLALGIAGSRFDTADLSALLDFVEAAPAGVGARPTVLILATAAGEAEHLVLAHRLRGLAEGCDVAVVPLDLAATAVELTARMVAGSADLVDPDLLPELALAFAGAIDTAAVLGDVSRLREPTPTLAQHARGLLPGACFLVSPAAPVLSGRALVQPAWEALVAGSGPLRIASASPGDRLAAFVAALPEGTVVVDPPPGAHAQRWGARNWVELSWLGEDPDAIRRTLCQRETSRCDNCGRRALTEVCPFCSAVTYGLPRRQEAQTS